MVQSRFGDAQEFAGVFYCPEEWLFDARKSHELVRYQLWCSYVKSTQPIDKNDGVCQPGERLFMGYGGVAVHNGLTRSPLQE